MNNFGFGKLQTRGISLLLFLWSSFAFALSANAQTADSIDTGLLTCVYTYKVQTEDHEKQAVTDSMQVVVQVARNGYKSQPASQFMDNGSPEDLYREALLHMPVVWNNHPSGKQTTRELIFPTLFESVETTSNPLWQLTTDTLTVSGYKCNSATADFAGIKWKAWYTTEIPVNAGPWKLCGLPGLIVSATDADSVHAFTLSETRQEKSVITYTPSPKVQKVSNQKLVKYRNKILINAQYPANPTYYLPDANAVIDNMTILKTESGKPMVLANGSLLLDKAHTFKPIEY